MMPLFMLCPSLAPLGPSKPKLHHMPRLGSNLNSPEVPFERGLGELLGLLCRRPQAAGRTRCAAAFPGSPVSSLLAQL